MIRFRTTALVIILIGVIWTIFGIQIGEWLMELIAI